MRLRWILASVPFFLITSAPFWYTMRSNWSGSRTIMASLLVAYGAVCCIAVGLRFHLDPRMTAIDWMKQHATPGQTIESSKYTPHWHLQLREKVKDVRMPNVSGRVRWSQHVLTDSPKVVQRTRHIENNDVEWYSRKAGKNEVQRMSQSIPFTLRDF